MPRDANSRVVMEIETMCGIEREKQREREMVAAAVERERRW